MIPVMKPSIISKPLITVITAVLNNAEGLQETLESILIQNFTQVEYVVVDGASTDNTVEVIKRYEQKFKRHGIYLNWISEKDNGIYEALNKGIDMAQGKYLIFMGAGDYFFPDAFKNFQNTLMTNQYDIVCGDAYHKLRQCVLKGARDAREAVEGRCYHQTIFYKADVFSRLGYYELKYPISSDYHFNLKCFSPKNNLKIQYVRHMIAAFQGGGVSEMSNDTVFWKELPDMIREHFGEELLRQHEIAMNRERMRLSRYFIKNQLEEKKINKEDRFIIYGSKEWGQRFYDALQKKELQIIAFSDSDRSKWYKKFNGHEIIPPEKIKCSGFTKILIASSAWPEIQKKLIAMGHEKNSIIYLRIM